jgi:mannose-6-phosphate isomerase-like protein (cupin superfamily)
MRWIIQRELGGTLVYFHQVILAPGAFEGVHQHIGSEELYYITEGEGIAYMGDGDDPNNDRFPADDQHIFGLGVKTVRRLPVKAGNVIFTKSGGIHGIRNPEGNARPLKFVAFGYSAS